MNTLFSMQYSAEKANVLSIKKNEKINYFAVALGKNGVMKKHKTPVPATLTMIKGEIKFVLPDEELVIKAGDFYEIPVEIIHEVIGLEEENLFTVLQEL